MKPGGGKTKGGNFERKCCKILSNWWTSCQDDAVFWRTASSGGLATQRSGKNKKTFGQYGDIQAINPIGQPLMDMFVIECKDGYSPNSIADMLDFPLARKHCLYLHFFSQVKGDARKAETPFWMLITHRKGKRIMVYTSYAFVELLYATCNVDLVAKARPSLLLIPEKSLIKAKIFGTLLDSFLNLVSADMIREMRKEI